AAAASHVQFLFLNVTALYQFVHAGYQVFVVITRIVILNDVAELLAISSAATRIWIEHDVTLGGHPLKFMIEDVAVRSMRSAVNIENKWVLLLGIKVGRLLNPCLNFLTVKARVPNLFRRGEIQLGKQLVIDVRQLLLPDSGPFQPEQVAYAGRGRDQSDKLRSIRGCSKTYDGL